MVGDHDLAALNNIFNKATIEALKLEIIEEVKKLPQYREKIYINPILQFGRRALINPFSYIASVILHRIKDFSLADNGHEYSTISLPEEELPDNLIHELRKPEKTPGLLTTGHPRFNIDFDHMNIANDKGEIILPLSSTALIAHSQMAANESIHEFEIEKLVHDIRQIIVNKTWEKFIERIE